MCCRIKIARGHTSGESSARPRRAALSLRRYWLEWSSPLDGKKRTREIRWMEGATRAAIEPTLCLRILFYTDTPPQLLLDSWPHLVAVYLPVSQRKVYYITSTDDQSATTGGRHLFKSSWENDQDKQHVILYSRSFRAHHPCQNLAVQGFVIARDRSLNTRQYIRAARVHP